MGSVSLSPYKVALRNPRRDKELASDAPPHPAGVVSGCLGSVSLSPYKVALRNPRRDKELASDAPPHPLPGLISSP